MQRVRVPLRLITGAAYDHVAVPVYVKIAALSRRTTGCEAGVAYLCGLLGLSRSSIERALTQLTRPDPVDDVCEVTSYRRTLPGGRGTTAVRRVRVTARDEHGAWVPTRAAEAMSPRHLRAYAALAYATSTGMPVSLTDLAQVLRHRSGKRTGEHLQLGAVKRLLDDLEALGWISVDRRAGYQGRHLYTCHDEPVQQVLDLDGGSGGDAGGGSLAIEEHHLTDSPDDPPPAVLGIRRRREQVVARGPVDNPPLPAAYRRPYAGPALSLAPRIWRVLEPVRHLLPGLSPYVVRQLAREVGRQLDEGQAPERLHARLQHRYASTDTVRDVGRWLLGAALIRHGCGLTTCESGRIWHTGEDCHVCAELRAVHPPPGLPVPEPPPPARPPTPRPARPASWCSCPDCQPAPEMSR